MFQTTNQTLILIIVDVLQLLYSWCQSVWIWIVWIMDMVALSRKISHSRNVRRMRSTIHRDTMVDGENFRTPHLNGHSNPFKSILLSHIKIFKSILFSHIKIFQGINSTQSQVFMNFPPSRQPPLHHDPSRLGSPTPWHLEDWRPWRSPFPWPRPTWCDLISFFPRLTVWSLCELENCKMAIDL